MKVLRVHAPGTPAHVAQAVGRAVVEFNRGLDIRLRFLSIGIEETVVEVADAAAAAEVVSKAAADRAPDAVVLLGDGPAALAAATSAVRARAALVRVGAGRREGPDADAARAVDRLASLLVVDLPAAAAALDAESLAAPRALVGDFADAAAGEKIVRAVSRARRLNQGGSTGPATGGR
jgi:UDP-N-acetylglucosamine 2-epimerase (non-hydrolysing)